MEYYIEAGLIVEYPNGEFGVLFNEVFIKTLNDSDKREFIQSLITIGKDWAFRDLESVDPDQIIEITPMEDFKDAVMGVRLLIDPDMNFAMNVYFGGRANPNKSVADGMRHTIEILNEVERQFTPKG